MQIEAPTLDVNCEATAELISDVISRLKGRSDPFAVLSSSDLSYMRALWTEDGFVLEYQDGSVDRHFESSTYLSAAQIEQAFKEYLRGDSSWRQRQKFTKKVMPNDTAYRTGKAIGRVFGSIVAGGKGFAREFRKGFDKTRK